jgi:DNA repair protein RadA/Sms
MAKVHSLYVCQQCGYESARWLGKCPSCDTWNSLVETVVASSTSNNKSQSTSVKPVLLSDISSIKTSRSKTKIDEFDQILGGGIVSGQVILISGNPGIGKSTLLLQIADKLENVLYVSGEESTNQIAIRANRLKIKNKNINIVESTDIDTIIRGAENLKPKALIVDSIQVMATSDLTGMAGSVGQVRECAFRLVRFAKTSNIPVFIVGHVTKIGTMAGPSVLAHIVDTVLEFTGDKNLTLRMIRAIKNRFGPTDEVGVFEMKDAGLVSVSNPEKIFIKDNTNSTPGSVVSAVMQGTRPVLVEIESLVVGSKLAFPRRIAQGIDPKRFELLLAVLTKHCKIPLYEFDCFINVAGGISAKNPSVDLAICMAVASSYFNVSIPKDVFAIGEVGLLGETRSTIGEDKTISLAKKVGLKKIISPKDFKYLQEIIHNFFMPPKKPKSRLN